MAYESRIVSLDRDGVAVAEDVHSQERRTGVMLVKRGGMVIFSPERMPSQVGPQAEEAAEEEAARRRRAAFQLPRDVQGYLVGFDEDGNALLIDRDNPEGVRKGVVIQHTGGRLVWYPSSDRPTAYLSPEGEARVRPGAPAQAGPDPGLLREAVDDALQEALQGMSAEDLKRALRPEVLAEVARSVTIESDPAAIVVSASTQTTASLSEENDSVQTTKPGGRKTKASVSRAD